MEADERLKRLVADEVGCCEASEIEDCRNANVTDRLSELEVLQSDIDSEIEQTDINTFSRLGDETRYTIVRLLVASDKELCACEIEPLLDVGQSALSHALSDLQNAGLVSKERSGKWHYYRPTERARAIVDAVDDHPL